MENRKSAIQHTQRSIEKVTRFYAAKDYQQVIQICEDCLQSLRQEYAGLGLQHLQANIISLRGAALMALGEFTRSLADLNEVLRINQFDGVSIRRRVRLYTKMGRWKQALEDLHCVMGLDPEFPWNDYIGEIQDELDTSMISDEKYRIKKMLSEISIFEDAEEEQSMLSFYNLKKIDRKSICSTKSKKETVFFGQDEVHTIEDKSEEERQKLQQYTIQQTLHKLQEQDSELKANPQINSIEGGKVVLSVRSKQPSSKKSILKKDNSKNITCDVNADAMSVLSVTSVKNIEGKFIQKTKSQIKFRKSQFYTADKENSEISGSPQRTRKSILKEQRYTSAILQNPHTICRPSVFLQLKNIEGKMFQLGKPESCLEAGDEEDAKVNSNSSIDSGEGEYNIYGNKQNLLTSEDCQIIAMKIAGNRNSNWSSIASSSAHRKSVLKPKNSIFHKKQTQRHTVNFKQ